VIAIYKHVRNVFKQERFRDTATSHFVDHCSLMYGAQDPSIAGMVLDSPFANLNNLMMELVDVYKIRLPKFTVIVS
jgi:hypothetical protein